MSATKADTRMAFPFSQSRFHSCGRASARPNRRAWSRSCRRRSWRAPRRGETREGAQERGRTYGRARKRYDTPTPVRPRSQP